jgi:hypothetical protein
MTLVDSQASKPQRDKSSITCYNCGKKGHFAGESPHKAKEQESSEVNAQQRAETQSQGETGAQMLMAAVADI